MSAQHTKGPWTLVPQSDGSNMIAHIAETGQQMQPKSMRLIAHVLARGNSLAEDEANARLIAAAPELLAALRAMLERYVDSADSASFEIWALGAEDKARAAIEKAEGR